MTIEINPFTGGSSGEAPSINKWVYASQYGSDTTGDGTYNAPYATVSKALSIITNASSTLRYAIHIRGTISEASIYLKPYVWYYGDTWGSSRLNASSTNAIQLYPGAYTSGNSRCGMTNVYMTGSTGISLDFVSQSAAGSHVVEMDNLGVNGNVVITPANTNQYFQWRGALTFGNFTVHGAGGIITDSFIAGDVIVDNGTAGVNNVGLNIISTFIGNNCTVTGDGTHTQIVQLTSSTVNTNASITQGQLYVDSSSLPLKAQVTIGAGGSIIRTSDVYRDAYTPTTPGDWPVVPTTIQAALDQLATLFP